MADDRRSQAENKSTPPGHPKTEPGGYDNQIKDPDDWIAGDEKMTGAQASYLKTPSEQAGRPEMFGPNLSKGEASERIDALTTIRGGEADATRQPS